MNDLFSFVSLFFTLYISAAQQGSNILSQSDSLDSDNNSTKTCNNISKSLLFFFFNLKTSFLKYFSGLYIFLTQSSPLFVLYESLGKSHPRFFDECLS